MAGLAWLLSGAMAAAAASAPSRVVTLQEATQTALANQPQIKQAQAQVSAAEARADQARAPLFPQVAGTASYNRSTANFVSRAGSPSRAAVATGGSQFDTFGFWNFGVSANQLIYDFGSTPDRWRATEVNAQAQKQTEQATEVSSVLAVRTAFFQARAQKALTSVAVETLSNQQKHLAQVQGFVDLGARPEIDLAQARTDVANAQVQLINAENNYATAKAQLNQAMGVVQPIDYDVADDSLPPLPEEDQGIDALSNIAFASRHELRSVERQIVAQEILVRATRATYGPSLSASTGLTDQGQTLDNLAWNWSGGITLSWSLFQGMLVPAQVREAQANLAGAKAQRDSIEQQIRLEVEQARLAVRAAKASLVAVDEALVNAKTRLGLAQGRYETGVGSALEISDAQLQYTNAAAQRAQAEYNVSSARAALLKALGRE